VALIEIRNLAKAFGTVKAVDGVTLDIGSGEFITLLGPSGSGKTTVLRMIAGFEDPDAGSISLDGEDITHLPPFDRDVNTVFQDYALFPHMNTPQIAFRINYLVGNANASRSLVHLFCDREFFCLMNH
jgi:putative spermidine/putrescine transport system ATP-binding protein